ncbi:hypothetical protein, partial [Neisseria meningitidis]|uniref:hypothetical protein n=1 Tax=Neisseria meningitidis TaxID=487 RepID=UPI001895D99F
LCLGFGCREGKEFCKGLILLFSQKQKTKNSNLKFVIPTKVGIQFLEFQSFPINCLSIECLDSRLRGNDGGAVSVFSDKFLKLKISSFFTKTENQKQKPEIRHSRAGGNLVRSVSLVLSFG